jgi:hypothetical protein
LLEQLGNVGSEVGRALKSSESMPERSRAALDRALELIDLTAIDPRWADRLKEILRAREVVCDYFLGDQQYGFSAATLEQYFMDFALAARR